MGEGNIEEAVVFMLFLDH